MLNNILFTNYKSFKEKQELELKPLTILIGKNSSGKSAVAKLFTLVENSLKGIFPEPLLLENGGIELGAEFKDLIYGRTRTGKLELQLEDVNEKLTLVIAAETGTKDLPKIFFWKLENASGITERNDTDSFKGFRLQSDDDSANIESLELNVDYIGPFRELPKRFYSRPKTSKIEKVGVRGENAYDFLIQDALTTEASLLKKVSDWYQENFEGWEVQVNQDKAPAYQIELTRDSGKLSVNLVDVGQGMSQALPLITRAFMPSPKEVLIIIEQPELHLHPAAHGNIAELFADSIKEGNKRYLIETHSQNFVLRLRRLVAENKLNKGDLIIYFVEFDQENSTSELKRIEVDELGEVSFWPENIFNESLDEALAIRKAQKNKNS